MVSENHYAVTYDQTPLFALLSIFPGVDMLALTRQFSLYKFNTGMIKVFLSE